MTYSIDELFAQEDEKLIEKAKEKASEKLLAIRLSEIRQILEMTQVEMAKNLGVKQPTVAGMERKGQDLRLSSLTKYVEAAGGEVILQVKLPTGNTYNLAI